MSALTPDCDPDLSNCGSPWSPTRHTGGGLPSAIVLVALLVGSVLLATSSGPGVVGVLAGGVALLSAVALGRRGVRLARSGLAALTASRPRHVGVPRLS